MVEGKKKHGKKKKVRDEKSGNFKGHIRWLRRWLPKTDWRLWSLRLIPIEPVFHEHGKKKSTEKIKAREKKSAGRKEREF